MKGATDTANAVPIDIVLPLIVPTLILKSFCPLSLYSITNLSVSFGSKSIEIEWSAEEEPCAAVRTSVPCEPGTSRKAIGRSTISTFPSVLRITVLPSVNAPDATASVEPPPPPIDTAETQFAPSNVKTSSTLPTGSSRCPGS